MTSRHHILIESCQNKFKFNFFFVGLCMVKMDMEMVFIDTLEWS